MPDRPSDHVLRPSEACTGCHTRRAFLRDASGTLAAWGTLAGLELLGPWRALEALAPRADGGTVRYPIPATDGVSIDRKHEVILCRSGAEIYAFALSCPHQNTALRALPKNAGFQCPKHHSRYQPNGTFISGRATRNMDRLQISRDGDAVVVDPDRYFESDRDPARWAAALVTL